MPTPIPPASSAGLAILAGRRERDPAAPNTSTPDAFVAAPAAKAPATKTSVTVDGFAKVVNHALDTASGVEYSADSVSREPATRTENQSATGEAGSASDLAIASADAEASVEMTVADRGRALAAFNEILAMQM